MLSVDELWQQSTGYFQLGWHDGHHPIISFGGKRETSEERLLWLNFYRNELGIFNLMDTIDVKTSFHHLLCWGGGVAWKFWRTISVVELWKQWTGYFPCSGHDGAKRFGLSTGSCAFSPSCLLWRVSRFWLHRWSLSCRRSLQGCIHFRCSDLEFTCSIHFVFATHCMKWGGGVRSLCKSVHIDFRFWRLPPWFACEPRHETINNEMMFMNFVVHNDHFCTTSWIVSHFVFVTAFYFVFSFPFFLLEWLESLWHHFFSPYESTAFTCTVPSFWMPHLIYLATSFLIAPE